MPDFFAERQTIVGRNGLTSFDDVWAMPEDWLQEPRHRHGGWCGVTRHDLAASDESRGPVRVVVKRRENHQRRSVLHPFTGTPTLSDEFRALSQVGAHGRFAPEVFAYGHRRNEGKSQAFLMLARLEGYTSLVPLLACPTDDLPALLRSVGSKLYDLHDVGYEQGQFFMKHSFVDRQTLEVRFLDFEHCRRRSFEKASLADFLRFFRRLLVPEWIKRELTARHRERFPDLLDRLEDALRKERRKIIHVPHAPEVEEVAPLYRKLEDLEPEIVVDLYGALSRSGEVDVALAALDQIEKFIQPDRRQPILATRADVLRRHGRSEGSAEAYRRSLELTRNRTEREFLACRLATLEGKQDE